MKITDYAPRAAPFDTRLMALGPGLFGVEVGVDVGAHAQAMLEYCDVRHLTLIDPWPNPRMAGYCEGRLMALGFGSQFTMWPGTSVKGAQQFEREELDFVYIDQEHDADSVAADLVAWFPKLRAGGILGYRNYTETPTPLKAAVDAFVAKYKDRADWGSMKTEILTGEIVIKKLETVL